MPTTRASKPRSGIYPLDNGFLFVPNEDMWNVHNASKPSAIIARAGLARVSWSQWRRKYETDHPWLTGWLYSLCEMPSDVGNSDFQPTPSMLAFRREAKIRATLAAATRSAIRMQEAWRPDYRPDVGEALLSYWRRMYKEFDWFDRWLLRGEDPPAEVTVVSVQQALRCSRAWDFATFCQRVGVRPDSTYVLWLSRRQIPNLAWLKWLFGAPAPAGTFVVGLELQHLRGEMGRKGILKAAGLNKSRIWQWERGELTREPIKSILTGGDGAGADGWDQISPTIRRDMDEVAKAASLEACCDRAGLSVSTYYAELGKAQRCGLKDELLKYLRIEGPYTTTKSRKSGLVADNLFIPTPAMLDFRAEAVREGTKQQIWSLHNLPGIDDWFLDWTTPKAYRGRRHSVKSGIAAAGPRHTITEPLGGLPAPAMGRSNRGAEARGDKGRQNPVNPGGRPTDDRAQAIQRYCYEKYVTEDKGAATVMLMTNKTFGVGTIKEDSTVRLYARRYARKHKLPTKHEKNPQG